MKKVILVLFFINQGLPLACIAQEKAKHVKPHAEERKQPMTYAIPEDVNKVYIKMLMDKPPASASSTPLLTETSTTAPVPAQTD